MKHQALLLTGLATDVVPVAEINNLLKLEPAFTLGSADLFTVSAQTSSGIEGIHDLTTWSYKKPFQMTYKIAVVLHAEQLTIPAQNALLKTLEEPSENTIIVLCAQNAQRLLPTVRSRCHVINMTAQGSPDAALTDLASQFWQGDIPTRLNILEGLVGGGDDRRQSVSFVEALLTHIKHTQPFPTQAARICVQVRKALNLGVQVKLSLHSLLAIAPV